jgi:hypothetical protein
MKNSSRLTRSIQKSSRVTGRKRAKPNRLWPNGKAAEARNAFREALESYGLALLNLLPESPERDFRELKLRQSASRMLFFMKGNAAP